VPGQHPAYQGALLAWYRAVARPLRIRSTREPWPVLVAEVMAQQTQIARVDAAWVAFMARFPTPLALAQASAADVLRAWAGLGYNRRALALQQAARCIVEEHGGAVPGSVDALEALPGVGAYTARAVAALAFGQPVAAVDTNVRRVMGRLLGRSLPPRALQAAADALVPSADAATWTQASMELGATICQARRPDCRACPVRRWCASVDSLADPGFTPRRDSDRSDRAGRTPSATRGRSAPAAAQPFERTSRWLRGRIVAHLRDVDDGTWVHLPEAIGSHGAEGIATAVQGLDRDGLVECRADGAVRLPSGAS